MSVARHRLRLKEPVLGLAERSLRWMYLCNGGNDRRYRPTHETCIGLLASTHNLPHFRLSVCRLSRSCADDRRAKHSLRTMVG